MRNADQVKFAGASGASPDILDRAKSSHKSGRLAEAEALYREFLASRPLHSEALHLLGTVLAAMGRAAEGAERIAEALRLDPSLPHGHYNLGAAWLAAGRPSLAEAACLASLKQNGQDADAFLNLGNALANQGRPVEALACFRKARKTAPTYAAVVSAELMAMHYVPGQTAARLRQAHENAAREWEEQSRRSIVPAMTDTAAQDEVTLKIGFVSPDLRSHPVGYFLAPYLRGREPGAILTVCYSDLAVGDAMTRQIKETSDLWRDTAGLSDEELADLIGQDGIHVLVDLAGYTRNNRFPLFARRAAPVQVTWAGYVGTTGLKAMDYLVTDARETPPGQEKNYTEALAVLPDGYVCYAPPSHLPHVGPLPALTSGRITFGSCNGMPKINGLVLDLWAEVMRRVPNSRLVLANDQLGDEKVRQAAFSRFKKAGISAARVELLGGRPHREFLETYNYMDVSLDTFPYTGGLTTLESLVMGVPVVAMAGETFAARHSLSHLTVAGLSDWVASSPEEYVATTVRAVRDPDALAGLRACLRGRVFASPLCDGARFARHLESAFSIMWRQHLQGVRRSFHVPVMDLGRD